jgi:hypothetical protein
MHFLVQLIEQLAAVHAVQPPLSQGQQQMLQTALRLVRDVSARDDDGRGLSGGGNMVAALQAAKLLPSVLAMLKALEPIQNPQRQQQQVPAGGAGPQAISSGGGVAVTELAPKLAGRSQRFPATPPYPGFRTDLLAAVANMAHRRPAVHVRTLGGKGR